MEALGRIAAGAAHDFNNHLTVISLHAELLAKSTDPRARSAREGMRESIGLASALARQLLVLGRRETRAPRPIALRALCERSAPTLRRVLPADLELSVEVEGEPWVVADEGQLHQTLLSLVLNARDACSPGGHIHIRARIERLTEAKGAFPQPIPAGEHAVLEVEDDGRGMDEATLRRATEPFFSTKEAAPASGLGLATTAAIARSSGGHLVLSSTLGKGTRVALYLPAAPASEELLFRPSGGEASLRGRTILFAEDGAEARRLTAAALEETGAKVLVAADGTEALDVIERHPGTIDLLCTDAVMPGAPVGRVLERWAERFPDAPVVVCSGHVGEELARRGIEEGRFALVEKPFSTAQLVATLAAALASPKK